MRPHDGGALRGLLLLVAAAGAQEVRVGGEALLWSNVADLQWLGLDKNVVLLHTQRGYLYRSEDGGESWTDIRSRMNRSSPVGLGMSASAPIRRIFRSPADANTVFAQGVGLDSFISGDAGRTWERIQLRARVQGFAFHGLRPGWALLSHWTASCTDLRVKQLCSHNLYFTKDFGRTFSLVTSHVVQFSWGKSQFGQSNRVYFTHFRAKSQSQMRLTRWMWGIDFSSTDDFGQTVTQLVPDGNKFQMSYDFILVVKVTNPVRQNVSLTISSDGGRSFDAAKLPHRLWQHSFSLLDASEGALVLHVNQGKDVGDIYISDRSGKRFTLSLTQNVRAGGLCAFEKVMNLDGIYVSNVLEGYVQTRAPTAKEETLDFEASSTETQLETMHSFRWRRLADGGATAGGASSSSWLGSPGAAEGVAEDAQAERLRADRTGRAARGGGGGGSSGGRQRRLLGGRAGAFVRTVISFDAGAAWSYLKPPRKDSKGNDIRCGSEQQCWLHLHDFTEIPTFSPVYSYKNAVGIIMASGNVGAHLSSRREDANTYLSRDGGLTWAEVHKGTFIYEFGNHGGLLVMADMVNPTTEALFSWDEGNSWTSFQIGAKPMRVENVIIEPDATATKFLVYGERNRAGVCKLIDFGRVHKRTCKGASAAGGADSDYEKWAVPCILGRRGVFTRRKRLSQCFNNETTDRYRSRRRCSCTQNDYECEVGFARKIGSVDCFLENPKALSKREMLAGGCPAAGKYAAKVYRKVPGDVCEGGWTPQPLLLPCPAGRIDPASLDGPGEGSSLPYRSIVLIGTIAAGVYCARSERLRGWLKSLREEVPHGGRPPGAAGEYRGTQIGHSSASAHEMVGLSAAVDGGPHGYRPPEI